MSRAVADDKLKKIPKSAIVEVLEERRDLLHDALVEALEDIALARAIEEGERTKIVRCEDVFAALDGDRHCFTIPVPW